MKTKSTSAKNFAITPTTSWQSLWKNTFSLALQVQLQNVPSPLCGSQLTDPQGQGLNSHSRTFHSHRSPRASQRINAFAFVSTSSREEFRRSDFTWKRAHVCKGNFSHTNLKLGRNQWIAKYFWMKEPKASLQRAFYTLAACFWSSTPQLKLLATFLQLKFQVLTLGWQFGRLAVFSLVWGGVLFDYFFFPIKVNAKHQS